MSAPYGHASDERTPASEWRAYLRGLDADELDGLCETAPLATTRHDAQDERDRRRCEAEDA